MTSHRSWLSRTFVFMPLAMVGCVSVLFSIAGCAKTNPAPLTRQEADKKFLELIQKDYELPHVSAARAGSTLWIYSPGERDIFAYRGAGKAKDENAGNADKKRFSVLYVESTFKDRTLAIDYDIIATTKTTPGTGISSSYTDDFNGEYRSITTALIASYADAQDPPVFVTMVIADIATGTEIAYTFCLEDMRKYQTGYLPPEEFMQRSLVASRGDEAIVQDMTGRHLEYTAMTWPEFLRRQINNRITFKFQTSDFTPDEVRAIEIARIAGETFRLYDFKDVDRVTLSDIRAGTSAEYPVSEILDAKQE